MTAIWLLLGGIALCMFLGAVTGFTHWLKKSKHHSFPDLLGFQFAQTVIWLGIYAFCLLIATSVAFGVNLVI